jgi:EAL domain-containing protein (putative c-di-GMP-specific phosphodiesterase class I)
MAAVLQHAQAGWVARIRQALAEDRFTLFAQPAAALSPRNSQPYVEVLVRLVDETGAIVLPGAFMPAAERSQQIEHIDRWVAARVFQLMSDGLLLGDEVVALNMSATSLTSPGFIEFLRQEITGHALPVEQICFEITESAAAFDFARACEAMLLLRRLGCRFALDDFGSGLASYRYLKQLPVDYVKIDGALVKDLSCDPINQVIVESMQRIARVMNIRTIAESVEVEDVRVQLTKIGVDYAQGYGIARPMPLHDCFATLA